MSTHAGKAQENKGKALANNLSKQQTTTKSVNQSLDTRPETIAQRKLQEIANSSAQVKQLKAYQQMADNSSSPVFQRKENKTGLPDTLKSGIENLSGIAMDDVKVHYNSSKPAQLNAHAYAQGSEIHIGSGQEKHLAHEAWHVVQQKQGRVKATKQLKQKVAINDEPGLEQEADVMGAKALQMKKQSGKKGMLNAKQISSSLLQKKNDHTVTQLVLATVNPQNGPINLTQTGGGNAFVIMHNPTQLAGNAVSNALGFTGVLNVAEWANLGKSPTDYWRAHAYANSFGGAGDITNVGWWKATSEEEWTQEEQNVRGAGLAQIPSWLPGTGETGTYLVDRAMHPAIAFKVQYVTDLMKAVAWGMDDSRDAWVRALATCNTIFPIKDREKRIAAMKALKATEVGAANGKIQTWVNTLFGANSLETNLIKSMKMTYTISNAGLNPGANRKSFSKTINSAQPNPLLFGLKNEPENIWIQLVNHNVGVFAQGAAPTTLMGNVLAYDNEPFKPAQQFSARGDGWGV